MVVSRTDTRLDVLEKATEEINARLQLSDGRAIALEAKVDAMVAEIRAGFAAINAKSGGPGTGENDPPESSESNSTPTGGKTPSPMPTFEGTDALAWLARAEQYFLIAGTTPENRVGIAMVALAGPALPWYQLLRKRVPNLSWARFARELMKRFGGNGALDEYEAFAAVRHTGSLVDYVAAFEARLAQVPDIASHQYLGFFMAALRPEVRLQMKAAKITTYEDAVELALDIDSLTTAHAPKSGQSLTQGSSHSRPPAGSFSKGYSHTSPALSSGSSRPGPKRFRNMSTEEYQKHIAAGTCFKCGLKFGPTHRCPPKTLNVLVWDNDDETSDDTPFDEPETADTGLELQLSELSRHGIDTSRTMKLFGTIGQQKVKVMVDSGASHCFISEQLASTLRLQITSTSPYSVLLGDGTKRRANGICHQVPLTMASETFSLSCYIFPLRNIDVILGVSWLASLGNVLANWLHSSMKFSVEGRLITIQGDPTLMRRACSPQDLRSLDAGDCCWVLRSVEKEAGPDGFGISSSLPAAARSELLQLVEAFPSLTRPDPGLPPPRHTDHQIPLLPGAEPVSVRPYRYNHLQKDEMEKLVAEMLASGVIQPSTSPYSSPVLLVRKKDGSWRFCVDYRELNKKTVPDKYPIPVIQELLDELHGARWFSKIDLKAGYHQIRVAQDDVHKTAFRTHSGHYEFLVMPFGLTNAPATFQSLMNDIFRPALRKFVLVFFDDILVYSDSWETHMRHLRLVFDSLHANSLVVNPKKCLLGRDSVEYLGHIVSYDGVRMDPTKVSAVLRWPTLHLSKASGASSASQGTTAVL
ncbi:uncharacterized protein LOC121791530 [Salvia splendens]|uniref:uncharacterized protein LOC121791530 n=1 Tax=Salvia splendens TaxID=180675 RepID=UPI001C280019|nr:uncharacterized protein LOC121791530 [Salvia splendens]